MNKEQLRIFKDPQETASAFGIYLMNKLENSEEFHCALSGGSTPKLLFNFLAEHYAESKVWFKLHVYWGDERCVEPTDDESNYKMTKELLLSKVDIPENNVHRIRGEEDPLKEVTRYTNEIIGSIHANNKLPVFDLVILGMGDDGHTASIFPHEFDFMTSENICEVATHPTSGQNRITLTGPVINNAREVVFLVTGEGKKERIAEIFNRTGNWEKYPASSITPTPGSIYWFIDQAAASELKDN